MVTRTVCLCLITLAVLQQAIASAFDFPSLRDRAQQLSRQPFEPATNRVPPALRDLSYTEYQAIEFKHDKALWADQQLPFQIEFFLPGSVHSETVVIHEVLNGNTRRVAFSRDAFSFGTNQVELTPALDYAGFRIIHNTAQFGEVASFLGASYFRMIGRGQAFGASARGLALNTVEQAGEEFPVFREFWIRQPAKSDKSITVWALLDSPSAAGALEMVIAPGATTVARVKAALFARREVKQFGIAPLTSMFLHDENGRAPFQDFRPEVHDSDGLLIHTARDEFQWRPLESGKMMRANAYQETNPKGFGLMQRDRDFEHYQDLTARFESRPSVWIKPLGSWGRGSVQLVQLPTNLEYTDNVAAFWVPETPPKPGEALDLSYETWWTTNAVTPAAIGRVHATRVGTVETQAPPDDPHLRFVIDFAGPGIEALSAREQLTADVHCGEGAAFVADTVIKNPINGTWRLVIEITAPSKAVDLRALLKRNNQPVTETWMYTWQP